MPSVSIRQIWSGRVGNVNDELVRQYKKIFRVLTNSMLDGPETVIATVGVPKRWEAYVEPNGVFDAGARCISVDAKPDQDDPFTWIVEAQFTTRRLGRLAGHRTQLEKPQMAANKAADTTNPFNRPTIIKYATVHGQKILRKDLDGKPVVNSAKQPLLNLMADRSRIQLTFTRNEMAPNFNLWMQYQDAINSDTFFGMVLQTVKLMGITADEQFEQEILYWSVSYTFLHQPVTDDTPRGWQAYILDDGTAELDPNANPPNSQLRPCYDKNNRPITGRVLLDGSGHQLKPANDPFYLNFKRYNEKPFAAFNLP